LIAAAAKWCSSSTETQLDVLPQQRYGELIRASEYSALNSSVLRDFGSRNPSSVPIEDHERLPRRAAGVGDGVRSEHCDCRKRTSAQVS
jgi:hypothetical protein